MHPKTHVNCSFINVQTLSRSFQSGWQKAATSITIFRHLSKQHSFQKAQVLSNACWHELKTVVQVSALSEKGVIHLFKYLNATLSSLPRRRDWNMCTGKKLSMVHPGPQSVDLRDEERRKYQAKIFPATHSSPKSVFITMWLEKSLFQRKVTFWQNKQSLQNYCKVQSQTDFTWLLITGKKPQVKKSDGQNMLSWLKTSCKKQGTNIQ